MKVAFNRRQKEPTIGPYIFLERLISYLESAGVEVVRNAGRFHHLHFINISGSGRRADRWKAKKVLRMDGIYHDLSINSAKRNEGIRDTYHNVDGVIFQCDFAREMAYKHFGKPSKAKHEKVIHNGVDGSFTLNGEVQDFGFDHTIIVSGKWAWPSKRLLGMIKCFIAMDRRDLGLVVLGEVEEKIEHPRIKYCGFIAPKELPSYYRGADIMLHLAYTDWCPNAVIEALACGVPVITTHNGGVPELIQRSGVVIKNEPDYDMKFVDFKSLPEINPALVVAAVDTILGGKQQFIHNRSDLSMERCGKQYLEFFRRVVV
jgi:glycosyltransferase involved in cell wall biosynthesis